MDKLELIEEVMKCVEEGICAAGEIVFLGIECIFAGATWACEAIEKILKDDPF